MALSGIWRAVVGLLAVAALLSGCGGGSSSGTSGHGASGGSTSGEHFDRNNWAALDSDPDAHKGATVDFVGQVFTAPQRDDKGTYLQVWADPQDSEWNTIVAVANPNFQVNEQDYVHVVGVVKGAYKGKNAFGGDVQAVTVLADKVTVVDATAAAPPAIATATVNASQTQHGVTITVSKVEFAPNETRVYVTVDNGSSDKAQFLEYESKAVQGSRQFDAQTSLDYPQVQDEILPGIKSSGIVLFGKLDPTQPTKLVLSAQSGNYMLNFKPYTFHVPAS